MYWYKQLALSFLFLFIVSLFPVPIVPLGPTFFANWLVTLKVTEPQILQIFFFSSDDSDGPSNTYGLWLLSQPFSGGGSAGCSLVHSGRSFGRNFVRGADCSLLLGGRGSGRGLVHSADCNLLHNFHGIRLRSCPLWTRFWPWLRTWLLWTKLSQCRMWLLALSTVLAAAYFMTATVPATALSEVAAGFAMASSTAAVALTAA